MESPLTWNKIQKCIKEALDDYQYDEDTGAAEMSEVSYIYHHLLDNGFIVDLDEEEDSEEEE